MLLFVFSLSFSYRLEATPETMNIDRLRRSMFMAGLNYRQRTSLQRNRVTDSAEKLFPLPIIANRETILSLPAKICLF